MPIASLQPQRKANPADIPLEKLATSKALSEKDKASEVTRQFEAVLVRQILTDAQKPAFPSKFSMAGVSNSIYQDMMVNQMADKISSSRTLGLSQQLESQLSRQLKDKEGGPAANTPVANISQAKPTAKLSSHASLQPSRALVAGTVKSQHARADINAGPHPQAQSKHPRHILTKAPPPL